MKTSIYTKAARLIKRLAASHLLKPRFEPCWVVSDWFHGGVYAGGKYYLRGTDFATPLDEAKARIRSKLHNLAFEVEMLDPEWEDIPF